MIELLIVIAIIGILAAIAIPMYRAQTVKARLSEMTQAMSNVASAVGAYFQDNAAWPPNTLTSTGEILNTLGVAIATGAGTYIDAVSVVGGTGVIQFSSQNTGNSAVDGGALQLIPSTTSQGAVTWSWSPVGTFPVTYVPKK